MKTQQPSHYTITVLGANGGIGSQVVSLALQGGYRVTAIVRNLDSLKTKHENLTVAKGDILQPETFLKHIINKDVVISTIGSSSLKETALYSQGAINLLRAMEETGTRRCYFISASGIEVNPSHNVFVRFATQFILQKILKNMYADLREMEIKIKQSDLDWTIVRPPRLIDAPSTGQYRLATNKFLNNGLSIARADIAHFMLSNIDNTSIFRSVVEVAY
jgi:putative NADH-flavin reductase